MIGSQPGIGSSVGVVRVVVGVEMEVVDVQATRPLVLGGRVNVPLPGEGGAKDQKDRQDE